MGTVIKARPPVDETIIHGKGGSLVRIAVGSLVKLSGGFTWKGERIFGMRGAYRVVEIKRLRGLVFLDVVKMEERGLTGAMYTARVTGGARRSRQLPNVIDRPYRVRLVRRAK